MNANEYNLWINDRITDLEQHIHKHSITDIVNKLRNNCGGLYGGGSSVLCGNLIITWDKYERTVSIHNNKRHTYGVAKCKCSDDFDLKTGIAIAWAKYNHENIPSRENLIHREELVSGDKIISSLYDKCVITFIGWLPNTTDGSIGKYAAIVNEKGVLLKTQIREQVNKIN